jgi:hypothetical protein
MSTIKSSADHLTINADGASKDIKFQANGVQKASISSAGAFTSTTIDATVLTGALPAISAASLTSIPAANLTGTLPAISGSSLTGLVSLTADQSWTGSQRATLIVDNDGSFDMNGGNNFKCTPAGNFTLTFTNITDGQSGFILLVNSGGHTVSAHANSKVDASLLATVTAAGTYLVSYLSDGTNVYLTNSAIYT